MNDWVQVIYEATGIPLNEENLSLRLHDNSWWVELYRYPIFSIGDNPARHASLALVERKALTKGMEKRLSETFPAVRNILRDLGGERADAISLVVLSTQDRGLESLSISDFDRGWPHFSLQLSAGIFDVEVDLNPYVPEDPFDPEELKRQAEIILQLVGDLQGQP